MDHVSKLARASLSLDAYEASLSEGAEATGLLDTLTDAQWCKLLAASWKAAMKLSKRKVPKGEVGPFEDPYTVHGPAP